MNLWTYLSSLLGGFAIAASLSNCSSQFHEFLNLIFGGILLIGPKCSARIDGLIKQASGGRQTHPLNCFIELEWLCNSLTRFILFTVLFTGNENAGGCFEKLVKSHQTNWIEIDLIFGGILLIGSKCAARIVGLVKQVSGGRQTHPLNCFMAAVLTCSFYSNMSEHVACISSLCAIPQFHAFSIEPAMHNGW